MYARIYLWSVVFCILQPMVWGQEVETFTYGGNKGGKYNGTVQVQVMIEDGNRPRPIEGNTINLNEYKGGVNLVIQFSGLRVGLNDSYDKERNSDHPKVFYLEASSLKLDNNVVTLVNDGPIRIGAGAGHYGKSTDKLVYTINPVTFERDVTLRAKAEIIDGVYDGRWNVLTVTKKLTIIPRAVNIENDLWAQIQKDFKAGNKQGLLEKCTLYRVNCYQKTTGKCAYEEDVLYYLIMVSENQEKAALVSEYVSKYPQGKYLAEIGGGGAAIDPGEPIEKDLARLDFDDKALLLNEVKGGSKPYYVSFFDYNKNKEHALKNVRFNKENLLLELESIGIPEGFYTVKVTDAKGEIFVEAPKMYVSEPIRVHPSVKLGGIVLLLGGLALVYKKYIHF